MRSLKKVFFIVFGLFLATLLWQSVASATVLYVCATNNVYKQHRVTPNRNECGFVIATFYDTSTVDSKLEEKIDESEQKTQEKLDEINQTDQSQEEKITQTQEQVVQSQTELIGAMESISQRVLTDEVLNAIRSQLKEELKAEILQELENKSK